MVIDGIALRDKIKTSLREEVLKSGKKLRLAVVKVGSDFAAEKFLAQKKKFAEEVGIDTRVYEIPEDISTNKLREKVSQIVHIKENSGVIVQLPLPRHINAQYILDAVIPEKDPDMLSSKSWGMFATGKSKIIPPVVGAIKAIFDEYGVKVKGARVTVVGGGRLVGKPVSVWLISEGATVSVIDENTPRPDSFTLNAGIVISGAGKPKFITPGMVEEGVVVIDAGTSESWGEISGDVDPEVSKKSSLFSPVPGGVGPLTVAMLFKNLVVLTK